MRYPAIALAEEVGGYSLLFPTCPGCLTECEDFRHASRLAGEALELWLEGHLAYGEAPPRPPKSWTRKLARRRTLLWIEVPAPLALRLSLRWARGDAGLTQAELAERAGVSQPAIAQIENPDANPTVGTLIKVADALGFRLRIELIRDAEATAAVTTPRTTLARPGRPRGSAARKRIRRTG